MTPCTLALSLFQGTLQTLEVYPMTPQCRVGVKELKLNHDNSKTMFFNYFISIYDNLD